LKPDISLLVLYKLVELAFGKVGLIFASASPSISLCLFFREDTRFAKQLLGMLISDDPWKKLKRVIKPSWRCKGSGLVL
jgi:hypothetical protein